MGANILTAVQIALSVAVLLIAIGRWGGKIESRASRLRNPLSTSPSEAIGTNGHASIGEIERRLAVVEAKYVSLDDQKLRSENNTREHNDLWGAIRDLRSMDSAQQRRIDGIIGSST